MPYVDASTLILTLQSHSKPAWDILNTELPDLLVELWVNSHVLGTHCLLCELDDLLDTLWCTLLESDIVHTLVQVDGVLALRDRVEGATASVKCALRLNAHEASEWSQWW